MTVSPWLSLKQAREELKLGRPDVALELVQPLIAQGYRKAIRLSSDIAEGFRQRAERHLRSRHVEPAWSDLIAAEGLNSTDMLLVELRQRLTRHGYAVIRRAMDAGQPLQVIDLTARLRERLVTDPELTLLEEVAQEWIMAAEQADRGEFGLARSTLSRAQSRYADRPAEGLQGFATKLQCRQESCEKAITALRHAANQSDWKGVLQYADAVVAAAPHHREARSFRVQAWQTLHPSTEHTLPYTGQTTEVMVPLSVASPPVPNPKSSRRSVPTDRPTPSPALPKRFLLWIDGVGGYLVCLGSRITFGQAVGDGPVDVPLFAEMSRLHAELTRDAEGYVLESTRSVQVNGQVLPRSVLRSGDRLTLGPTCQMLFHLPIPISPTARLELVSGHRLPLAVDGVLLMAESLILGPSDRVHVPMPEIPSDLVVYRSPKGLGIKYAGRFRVDGQPCEKQGELPLPGVVESADFTLAVEPVGPRL